MRKRVATEISTRSLEAAVVERSHELPVVNRSAGASPPAVVSGYLDAIQDAAA